MAKALLIIDVQVGMFDESNPVFQGELLLLKVAKFISSARLEGTHIVYIQHNAREGKPLEKGKPGWMIHPDVSPQSADIIVQKNTPDAFHNTNLQNELESRGINELLIAGIQTEVCVDTTCRRAFSLGYEVKLISDLHSTWDSENHQQIWTYSPSSIGKLEEMEIDLNQWLKSKELGSRYPFVIFDNSTREIVGSTSFLDISLQNRKLEIGGTWLDPKVWRTSVNTECKFLMLKYCFEKLNLVRVQLRTDVRNERSNRAIQRIGAHFEGTLRQDMIMHDGFVRDSNVYSILDQEWESVKDRLLGFLKNGDR
jgi:RimJ/RimL family protein N-acetyltransferase